MSFGLGDMMKKAQEMQEQMQKAREVLAGKQVTGEAGAGLVRVTMNGIGEVLRVEIDPSMLAASEQALVQDMVRGAVNNAYQKVSELARGEMSFLSRMLPSIPGLNLPF